MIVSRSGKNVAIVGGVCQLIFSTVMVTVWLLTGSFGALACAILLAGGLGLWLVTALLFYCRQLARREEMELAELSDEVKSSTIFEGDRELQSASATLVKMTRWAPPISTVVLIIYHAVVGILMLRYFWASESAQLTRTGIGTLFVALIAFGGFLLSRYCTGMARQGQWRLLRAPGGFLLLNVLFAAALVGAILAGDNWPRADVILACIVAGVQIVLAAELVASLIMDFYRPRIAGREHRSSYDSRLCSLLAEPQRVGRSVAETLNYQFGFEVSKTWFYRLMAKALFPLIVLGMIVLFAISSIVIVPEGSKAVVLHWGQVDTQHRILSPGVHFKWPWPIDVAESYSTETIYDIWLGLADRSEADKAKGELQIVNGRRLELWTRMHTHNNMAERDFILASPRETTSDKEETPQVSVIKLVALVRYVIEDPYKYGYRFVDPAKMLECAAYREMIRYCACATLFKPAGDSRPNRPEAIMTYGRRRAEEELKKRIQKAFSDPSIDIGVKVVGVVLRAVHPPAEAADAFEEVLIAKHQMNIDRYQAQAEANSVLSNAAGSPTQALDLAMAIRKHEGLDDLRRLSSKPAAMRKRLDKLIYEIRDDIGKLDREIETQALLGQIRGYKHRLRDNYRSHLKLLEEIRAYAEKGKTYPNLSTKIKLALKETDELFNTAGGQPASLVAAASAKRWEKEMAERSRLDAFRKELPAYQASANIYMLDRWLDVWDKILPKAPKYVIGVDRDKLEVWMNLERQDDPTAGLYTEEAEN